MFHCRDTLSFQRTLAGASPEARDWPQFNRNIHVLKAVSELEDLAELAPWLSSTLMINFLHCPMTFGTRVLLQAIPSSQQGIPQSQAPSGCPHRRPPRPSLWAQPLHAGALGTPGAPIWHPPYLTCATALSALTQQCCKQLKKSLMMEHGKWGICGR